MCLVWAFFVHCCSNHCVQNSAKGIHNFLGWSGWTWWQWNEIPSYNPSKGGVSAAWLKQPWNNLMTWDKPTINCAKCWDIFYKSPVAQISYETNCLGWPFLYVEDPFGGDPPIAQVLRQDDCGMCPAWKNPSYSPILHRILRGLIHQG